VEAPAPLSDAARADASDLRPDRPRVDLTALVEALRRDRFRAGPGEAVNAARLLARLALQPHPPEDPRDWLPWLRPVFCTTREEQARFDPIFMAWAERVRNDRIAAAAAAPAPEAAPDAEPRPRDHRAWWRRPGGWIGLAGVLVLLAGAWVWQMRAPAPGEPPTVATPPRSAPAEPAPPTAVAATRVETVGPRARGLYPALRESRHVDPTTFWIVAALPALLLLLSGTVPGFSLLQGRRRSDATVRLDSSELQSEARRVLPALPPDVAARLERHVRERGDDDAPLTRRPRIDTRRTVEGMLRRRVPFRIHYRSAPVRPSYLVLIDTDDERDPRGRLFMLWGERLRREGLDVDIRLFRHATDPAAAPLCRRLGQREADGGEPGLPLDRLPDPSAGQRLVVVSEAHSWLDAQGRWRPWFLRARLHRWRQRVFFTPVDMRHWGAEEEAIEAAEHGADLGFLVLPLDEGALDAWSRLLVQGSLPAFELTEPQSFPPLLSDPDLDPFAAPSAERLDQLVAQLILYLGDAGYRWLCALAVPPIVRWELTLLIGRRIVTTVSRGDAAASRELLGRCYRRIARLPWFRGGYDGAGRHRGPALPVWLRLRLLDELPSAAQDDIRTLVGELLARVRRGEAGSITLDFEVPPAPGRAAPASGDGDQLYLGYLSGMTPSQLAQRMPPEWRAWLRDRPLPAPGWSARLRRQASGAGRWLEVQLARLNFRGGLPWAGRGPAPLIVAGLAWGVLIAATARLDVAAAPGQWSSWLEASLVEPVSQEVRPPAPTGEIVEERFTPDGRIGLLAQQDGSLLLWRTDDGRPLHRLHAGAPLVGARFDAAGERVFGCTADGYVRAWSVGEGAELAAPAGLARHGDGAVYRRCRLSADAGTALWVATGRERAWLVGPRVGTPREVDGRAGLSPNGRWLVEDDRVSDLNRPGSAAQPLERSIGRAPAATWSGDTLGVLDSIDDKPVLRLLRLDTREEVRIALDAAPRPEPMPGRVDPARVAQALGTPPAERVDWDRLALSANGRYAALADSLGAVTLWDLVTRNPVAARQLNRGPIAALHLDARGDQLHVRAEDGAADLLRSWQPALAARAASLADLSADGNRLATARRDGRVEISAIGPARAVRQLTGPREPVALSISPDGTRLAIADARELLLWTSLRDGAAAAARHAHAPAATGKGAADAAARRVVLLDHAADGRLVIVYDDGELLDFDAARPQADPVGVRTGLRIAAPGHAAMRADGTVALFDREARRLVVLDPGRGRDLREIQWPARRGEAAATGESTRLGFGSAGRWLWIAQEAVVEVIDLDRPLERAVFSLAGRDETVADVAFDDAGDGIAVVSSAARLYLRRGARLEPIEFGEPGNDAARVRWLDAATLLIAERGGAVQMHTIAGNRAPVVPGIAPLRLRGEPQALEVVQRGWRVLGTSTGAPAGEGAAAVWSLPRAPLQSRQGASWAPPRPAALLVAPVTLTLAGLLAAGFGARLRRRLIDRMLATSPDVRPAPA
jgi:hypothetical protein